MKKITTVALFWAATLATASFITLNEWPGIIATLVFAGAYVFDASLRRMFDV